MDLYSLICKVGEETDIKGVIREYAVRKLAQQLYDCVECCRNPRAETDWLTAEKFVNAGPSIDQLWGFYAYNVMGFLNFPRGESATHEAIRQGLRNNEVMDRVLGRKIWDWYYQIAKRYLPCPPYGLIIFE